MLNSIVCCLVRSFSVPMNSSTQLFRSSCCGGGCRLATRTLSAACYAHPSPCSHTEHHQQDHIVQPAQVGALLLQQPLEPCPPQQVGVLLLQQPVPPARRWPSAVKQHQQNKQQQQHQRNKQQPQLCQRSLQALPPEVLGATEGYTVSRRERYMAPEAAVLQGHTLPDSTMQAMQDITAAAESVAAAAAASADAATATFADAQELLQSFHNTYTSRKLVVAVNQSSVFDHEAPAAAAAAGLHAYSSAEGMLRQLLGRRRRRTSTSTSTTSINNGTADSSTTRTSGRSTPTSASSRSRQARQNGSSSSSSCSRAQPDASPPGPSAAAATGVKAGVSTIPAAVSSKTLAAVLASAASPADPNQEAAEHGSNGSSSSEAVSTSSNGDRGRHEHSTSSTRSFSASSSSHASAVVPAVGEESEQQLLQRMALQVLQQHNIDLPFPRFGQQRPACPHCEGGSTQEAGFCVTLQRDGTVLWICHRATCGFSGRFKVPLAPGSRMATPGGGGGGSRGGSAGGAAGSTRVEQATQLSCKPVSAALQAMLQPLSPALLEWFGTRGIPGAVLERNGVRMQRRYMRALQREEDCIALPFRQQGEVVNIKYRALPKHFSQVQGGQQVFYGIDDLQGATHAIIVEGEMDKLAIEAATGHTAVVSLPAGAVPSSSSPFKPHSKKLECVDRAAQQLSQLQECLIAVDGDGPGWATAQALANRVRPFLRPGAALHYLAWPSAGVGGQETLQRVAQAAKARGVSEEAVAAAAHCKDANDVLMTCGPEFLRTYLQHGAVPFPNM